MSTNLLENQDFIELARKISILELYSLMILNRSFLLYGFQFVSLR